MRRRRAGSGLVTISAWSMDFPFRRTSPGWLLLESADVSDQRLDLVGTQFAVVGGHLGRLALGDGGGQVGVRRLLHVGGAQVLGARHLALAIGSMAHGTLGLEQV